MADALLGDPFLDKGRLRWTIDAVRENEGKIDVLAESAVDAIDTGNENVMLSRWLRKSFGNGSDGKLELKQFGTLHKECL